MLFCFRLHFFAVPFNEKKKENEKKQKKNVVGDSFKCFLASLKQVLIDNNWTRKMFSFACNYNVFFDAYTPESQVLRCLELNK